MLLFPGRTEYVEKYGPAAGEFAHRGYAMATIDWRGQGIADRLLEDRAPGHVGLFADYQRDVAALVAFLRAEALPEPWFLVGHSMGGCIGLRALHQGLPVRAAAFSAPMWGILIAAWMRPLAVALSTASKYFAFDQRYAPGTGARTYVLDAPFLGNSLTTDAEMWGYMRDQAQARPELTLGGPSLGWLKAALHECHALAQIPAPRLPALTGLGTQERIVDVAPVHVEASRLEASDTLFGREYNEALVHQVLIAYQANGRGGNRAQKGRHDVRHSTKKPWRQKGTGRARAGMSSSPIWRGGGQVFPSSPDENFAHKLNRKMYRAGMASILSQLAREDRLAVVDNFTIEAPKTKIFSSKIKGMGYDSVLVITDDLDENVFLAARNLPNILVVEVQQADPVSLVRLQKVLMTRGALAKFEEILG